jgi:hypothetical protein
VVRILSAVSSFTTLTQFFLKAFIASGLPMKNGGNPLLGAGNLMNVPFGLYANRRFHLANGRQ